MNLDSMKKVYLSGIGGIGVSAVARYFLNLGKEIYGSDASKTNITEDLESLGIAINYSQNADNITDDIDLFIYSTAVPENNPERKKAKELGINQMSYNEFLGWLSEKHKTIAVSGTNGKTTTTAKIANVLIDADLDPNVIVGSNLKKLGGNFRSGKNDLLVLEACEYRSHFLNLNPNAIVLTNIEEDHLDYFENIDHILQTFQKYIDKLKNTDDILVINKDDENIQKLNLPGCQVISYGFNEAADVIAKDLRVEKNRQKFNVSFKGDDLGEFELKMPGAFNVYNALAAIALALKFNINIGKIKESLANFSGTWRRFEIVKENPHIISDYAHHPTAVEVTRQAVEDFYPDKNKIIVFQPHQHNRTKKLFNDFAQSLMPKSLNELIIVNEIFDVCGREEEKDAVSSKHLVEQINKEKAAGFKNVIYSENIDDTLDLIKQEIDNGTVVLVMGAGDIYEIVDQI